jgi:hypothetical protein
MLPPHEVVDLRGEDQKRKAIPVFLTDEIYIEFVRPFIRYVLLLSVFRTDRVVNVMSDLMEEHMPEPEVSQKRDSKRNGR